MAFYYFDTSGLVKNYVDEPGSVWVRNILSDSTHSIFTSQIALPEVGAAMAILHRQRKIRREQRDKALNRFLSDTSGWYILDVNQKIVEMATRLTQQHPVKGYDAVHLASALRLNFVIKGLTPTIILVSGDKQLLRSAQAEGLATDDPFDHAEPDASVIHEAKTEYGT